MSSFLKQLKSIRPDIKFTVFGYVRQSENELSLFCNVPSMISYLCLSYYFHGDYFEKAGDDIQISNDKTTITKISEKYNWFNTSYGKTWIESSIPQIVEWKFKINKKESGCSICLCLVSCDNRLNFDCCLMFDAPNYGFRGDNRAWIHCHGAKAKKYYHNFQFKEGYVVSMILDTKERCLYFKKNGKQKVLFVTNMKIGSTIKYKMAVSLREKRNSISLIDFKCHFI